MRVLHMTSELDGGGVDRILFDYCSRMMPSIKSDFLVSSESEGILEAPLRDLGCKVFHVAKIRENMSLRHKQIEEILANGHYQVVHDHSGYKAYHLLKQAKDAGVSCRIAHAHIAGIPESNRARFERMIFTPLTKKVATDLYACGGDAARWMWGENEFSKGDVRVMPNGIQTSRFEYSPSKRKSIRKELGIEDKFVIGNVARFSEQKNHKFLLHLFSVLKQKEPDTVLMLIGRGELDEEVRELAVALGIHNSVMFMGVRNDVADLLNAMDVFVLPSRYEGLPVTLVEVQANGLPVVASNVITPEVAIAPNYTVLSLDDSLDNWSEAVLSASKGGRNDDVASVVEKYDIDLLAKEQLDWYFDHAR